MGRPKRALLALLLTAACRVEPLAESARWFEPRKVATLGTGRCLVLTSGQVACQYEGEAPSPPLPEPAIGIAQAADAARCALLKSGKVACWGCSMSADGAFLGFWSLAEPIGPARLAPTVLAPVQGATQVAVGRRSACAIVDAGEVACWGSYPRGTERAYTSYGICREAQHAQRLELPPARRIAIATDGQVCSVGLSGAVHCLGSYWTHQEVAAAEARGILYPPDEPTRRVAVPPALNITAGEHHFCSLGTDGSVWCWGANDFGQSGPRPQRCPETQWDDCKVAPAGVPLPAKAVDITAGERHSCAVLEDGRVACWGHNPGGVLGFASEQRCFPYWRGYCDERPGIVEGVSDVVELFATRDHSTRIWALTDDGKVSMWPGTHHRYLEPRSTAPPR